jgi:putative glutamine transport system substrate-binding protein
VNLRKKETSPWRRPYRMLPVLLIFLGALLGLASGCGGGTVEKPLLQQVKERGRLIAGVKYDSKPFGYLDTDGQLKGYDIDLIRELARRMLGNPQAVEFQQVLSSTRVIAINSGSVDVVAATMTITPDREKVVDFSEPYYIAGQAVMVPAKSPVKQLSDLDGKTILFVMGTTSEANIRKRLPKARYTGFKTSTDAFSALKAGRGDAMTTDDTILAGFIADDCKFRLLPERLSKEPYGFGIRQDEQAESTASFRAAVNEALAAMKADGTLDRLREKWMAPYERPVACPR